MSMWLEAIGTAVPQHFIEQTDAAAVAKTLCASSTSQQQVLTRLYQRSGIRTRHSVVLQASTNCKPAEQAFFLPAKTSDDAGPTTAERMGQYEESAADLGLSAARDALAKADTTSAEITHLITVSCTGFHAPGMDVTLVRELGLNRGVARTHIGFMGCHAALNALRVAEAFTRSHADACVLLCAVELCSLHYQYGFQLDQMISNALFADGAAAVVVRGRASERTVEDNGWRWRGSASTIVPQTEEVMSWHVRDHGFEMSLSAKVPKVIQQRLRPWLEGWLSTMGLSIGEIASWAVHPGGPQIVAACGEACGLGERHLQPSLDVLAEYGNMSSPTILFILDRLRQQSSPGPCVALAFGPGLTIEAALLD